MRTYGRKLCAWILVTTTVLSGINPSVNVHADEDIPSTEVIEVFSEETTSEEVEVVKEVETSEVTIEEAGTEKKAEIATEATSETTSEDTSEGTSELSSEESTTEMKEEGVASSEVEKEEKKEESEEKNAYSLFFNVSEGGTVKLTYSDGSSEILENKNSCLKSTKNGTTTDLVKEQGYYKVYSNSEDTTVNVEVVSKEGFKIETYSKLIDGGEKTIVDTFNENVYKTSLKLSNKNVKVNVNFSTEVEDEELLIESQSAGRYSTTPSWKYSSDPKSIKTRLSKNIAKLAKGKSQSYFSSDMKGYIKDAYNKASTNQEGITHKKEWGGKKGKHKDVTLYGSLHYGSASFSADFAGLGNITVSDLSCCTPTAEDNGFKSGNKLDYTYTVESIKEGSKYYVKLSIEGYVYKPYSGHEGGYWRNCTSSCLPVNALGVEGYQDVSFSYSCKVPVEPTNSDAYATKNVNEPMAPSNIYTTDGIEITVYDKSNSNASIGILTVQDGETENIELTVGHKYYAQETKIPCLYVDGLGTTSNMWSWVEDSEGDWDVKSDHGAVANGSDGEVNNYFEFQDPIAKVSFPINIHKVDAYSGAPVPNTSFGVCYVPSVAPVSDLSNLLSRINRSNLLSIVSERGGNAYAGSCTTNVNGNGTVSLTNAYYGTYFVYESSAPLGYSLSNDIYGVVAYRDANRNTQYQYFKLSPKDWNVSGNVIHGSSISLIYDSTFLYEETPITGTVQIKKQCGETEDGSALSGTTFKGIKYQIYADYSNNINYSPRKGYTKTWLAGSPITHEDGSPFIITCEDNGIAEIPTTASHAEQLPLGNYFLKECEGNEYYINDDSNEYHFKLIQRFSGSIPRASLEATGHNDTDGSSGNTPKRGDFNFKKLRSKDNKPLGKIPFLITNKVSGEKHIVVTDVDGTYNSSNFSGTNVRNTNDNLLGRGLDGDDIISSSEINTAGGVWFGKDTGGNNTFKESSVGKPSLPVGSYYFQELYCEGNSHFSSLYNGEFTVTENGNTVVSDADIVNEWVNPTVITKVKDEATGTRLVAKRKDTVIIDTVTLTKLAIGHDYGIRSEVYDLESHEVLKDSDGKEITSQEVFKATANNMDVDVKFSFNSLEMGGKSGVVQLELYDLTEAKDAEANNPYAVDYLVAVEKDFSLVDQTIVIPDITTEAYDVTFGNHVAMPTFTKINFGNSISSNGENNGTSENTSSNNSGNSTSSNAEGTGSSNINSGSSSTTSEVSATVERDDFNRSVTVNIKDKVTMYNFLEGHEYLVTGQVYQVEIDKNDKKKVILKEKVAEVTLEDKVTRTIENPKQDEVTLEYTIKDRVDTREGMQYIVYEQVYYIPSAGAEPILVAWHEDPEDEHQKVYVVGLTSWFRDGASERNVVPVSKPGEKVTFTDVLNVNSACIGEEYTLTNELRYTDTGETVVIDGKEVKQSRVIKAEKNDFEETFEYTLDTSSLRGKNVTFVEYIEYKGVVINEHDDLNNTNEQLIFPDIATKAKDSKTQINLGSLDSTTIIDTVEVKNSQAEVPQTVKGILMDKATGEYLGKDLGVGPYEAKVEITPEKKDYTVDVNFNIPDSKILEGKDVVVFEELYINNTKVAYHEDINDLGQTVTFVKERTTATWDNGTKLVNSEDKEFTLNDVVHYIGLIPGKTYTQTGSLVMDDGEGNAVPFMVNGIQVTSTVTFVPETPEGDVVIPFVINTKDMQGTVITVFEDLYLDDIKIATHSDLSDKDQTVYLPKIGTTATSMDGEKELAIGKHVKLKDVVEYENLIIGEKYVLKGKVVTEGKNGKIKSVTDTKEKEFTASTEGYAEMTFKVDTSKLEGKDLVVFEEVYDLEGNLVAQHKDIDDKGQTVTVERRKRVPRTLDTMIILLLIGAALVLVGGTTVGSTKSKKEEK